VVSVADGAPVDPLAPPAAPSIVVLAPVKATTVIDPEYDPLPRLAATTTLLNGLGATACQISAVPAWPFVRDRRRQVNPPPVTPVMVCEFAVDGPSEEMNATISSLPDVVVNAGALMLVPAVDWWVTTILSTAMFADAAGVVAVAMLDAPLELPAASTAVTTYV
jgi:hypothetical protein